MCPLTIASIVLLVLLFFVALQYYWVWCLRGYWKTPKGDLIKFTQVSWFSFTVRQGKQSLPVSLYLAYGNIGGKAPMSFTLGMNGKTMTVSDSAGIGATFTKTTAKAASVVTPAAPIPVKHKPINNVTDTQ